MSTWQLQDAKARLSEVIDTAKKKGPQVITRRGVEVAVLVPVDRWKELHDKPASSRLSEREKSEAFLRILQSGPQGELPIPARGKYKNRKPVIF